MHPVFSLMLPQCEHMLGPAFCITSHDIVDSVGLVVWKLGMFGGTLSKRLYVIEHDDRSNIGI